MPGSELETIEQLNDYWDEIARGAEEVPAALDPALASAVHRIRALDDAPAPDPAFARGLRRNLEDESPASPNGRARVTPIPSPLHRPGPASFRWPLAALAAALLVVLALGVHLSLTQPAAVSAEEIVRRAKAVATSPGAAGVESFASTEMSVSRMGNPRMSAYAGLTGGEEIRGETRRWYEAPDRWRIEGSGTVVDARGEELPDRGWHLIGVGDGKDAWHYDVRANSVTVREADAPAPGMGDSYGGESPLGQGTIDPLRALEASNPKVRPELRGEEVVAGREAYVLAFPTGIPSASAPEMNGPRTVWVDKETYFVLKVVQISGTDGGWLSTAEVTSIQYDAEIDPSLFAFAPPEGAKVDDQRPKPAPTVSEFQWQMGEIAAQADFPVFLPAELPDGLVPRQPRTDDALGVRVEYVPPAEADGTSFPTMTLTQQRATHDLVSRWTERAESATVPDATAWLRRGFRDVDGTGTDSAAMVLRDGTLISISSFTLSPDELLRVAASLAPVPGAHAPLPNPTAPSMDDVRQRASFKLFLPEYVPAGLAPEPPVAGSSPGSDRVDGLTITYHSSDGAIALRLGEGLPGDLSWVARPMLAAPEVEIREGITGRLMEAPSVQTLLLWWVQNGTYISLETRVLSREELLKVAASMSPAAGLGEVEPVTERPTPTPVPAPGFTVLRPTWLPEEMVVQEQYRPDPTGRGSEIVIAFDPRPDDTSPHGVLMLTETAVEAAGDREVTDPEAIRESIGGQVVTIIMRGEEWITLMWEQGDVALMLTNPYDPPGHPRYTPDELRKVVESIR